MVIMVGNRTCSLTTSSSISSNNKFLANCLAGGIIIQMNADAELMTSEQIKWILSRDFPPLRSDLPMRDQIALALQDLGFDRVRVTPVIHHPVWNVSANVGGFRAESLRAVKMALKKMCGELGFKVRMNEIVAGIYRGRLNAAFALVPPNAAPVEVEDDGHRVPDDLDFEDAA
jgi:hypothetical protein